MTTRRHRSGRRDRDWSEMRSGRDAARARRSGQQRRTRTRVRRCEAVEYVDTGISAAKDRRPALDRLMHDAKSRRVDVVVCWRLDRFGRSLRALIMAMEELNAAGVAFVSMGENIDTACPTGRLLSA